MGRKKVNLFIEERLWDNFKRLAFEKHENFHGALSEELEQALQSWLAQHTQNTHKQLVINKVNPQPRVFQVFTQVKEFLKEQYGYASLVQGQQVPRKHIIEALISLRGSDYRTVNKWMGLLSKFKLIKWVAGEVYEVL